VARRCRRACLGGEQQRVAIARAIVNRPSILIADEPTAHLDPAYAADIAALFRSFNQAGVTVLVSTHDASLFAASRPRRLVLAKGLLVEDSRPGRATGAGGVRVMINWFYLHLRAIGHALRRLVAQPLGTLLSALVVGIALSLPGGGYLLLDNLGSLARGVSGARPRSACSSR
jgi:energy-coupling factor transporter ATP-binding protein EcfA2